LAGVVLFVYGFHLVTCVSENQVPECR
jgi:hypothetical protein